jgi:hypothetical protein
MTDAIGTVTMYPKLERREWIFGTLPDPRDARIAELEAALRDIQRAMGVFSVVDGEGLLRMIVATVEFIDAALMPSPESDMTITQEAMDA